MINSEENFKISNSTKIDVVLICLNDEIHITRAILGLADQNSDSLNQLIVVDGGSTDHTLARAEKLPCKIAKSPQGMLRQTKLGLNLSDSPLVLLAEADHVYPPNFLRQIQTELLESQTQWDCLAASIEYLRNENFFERGHRDFLKVHYMEHGAKEIVAGTQLWRRRSLVQLLGQMEFGDSFCFDTERAEVASSIGIKFATARSTVYEDYKIDFAKFIQRHRNYGYGDFEFYTYHKKEWTLRRKFKSLFHVFRQYVIRYPFAALRRGFGLSSIAYFWLIAVTRYFFWTRKALEIGRQKRFTSSSKAK